MGKLITNHPYSFRTKNMRTSAINLIGKRGFYLKINSSQANWEVMYQLGYGSNSRTSWDSRLTEIQENDAFKGFQIDAAWGLYEKGVSGGDFSNLDYLVKVADEAYAVGRYLIINVGIFREFRNSNVSSLPLIDQMRYMLPPDMRTHQGLIDTPNVPAAQAHYLWDYAFAYDKALNTNFGYDLKTYKLELRARFARFCWAVANKLGNHPAVIMITSTESVFGDPVYTGTGGFAAGEGASKRNFLDGKTLIMDHINATFKRQMVAQNMNYPNEGTGATDPIDYLGEWFATAESRRYAITTPNSNWWVDKLNRVATQYVPQGINRYFPGYTGVKAVQGQGDEFDSLTNGAPQISTTADYNQRYADLYLRWNGGDGGTKFGLGADLVIIQREHPQDIWIGGVTSGVANVPDGVTVPSLKEWLKNPANVPQDGKGGLNVRTPSYIT